MSGEVRLLLGKSLELGTAGKGTKKTIVAENGPFGTPFRPPKSPRKSLCGSLFCDLSQEIRHINFFLGAQKGGFWVGAKRFMLEKFMCFFRPLAENRSLKNYQTECSTEGQKFHKN